MHRAPATAAAVWTLAWFCCVLGPTSATAQVRRQGGGPDITVGLRSGRDFENHAWSLGLQAGLRIHDRLDFRPSGDYFLGDRTPFRWQLNADLIQSFGPRRRGYAGGGAAFTRVRPLSSVKTGYNLFFGLVLAEPEVRSRLFLEFRWTFVNRTSPFRLVAGFSRPL